MTSKSIGSVAADANVLLSAVIGKAARRVFDGAPELRVVTSEVLGRRDPDDIALAAVALTLRIPFWSHDKDLDEVPLERYTTGRLLNALGL